MKNLSNVNVEEFLSKCPPHLVEGRTISYNNKTFYIPYETITVQGVKLNGLRENEDRLNLFENIIEDRVENKNSYLDVGSNMGIFVRYFSDNFEKVSGVELEDYYINICKYLYPEIQDSFRHHNLNYKRLSEIFPDETFDVVSALSMIEYITNKEDFVEDLFNLTNEICIVEGHSEDINKGLDITYENLLKAKSWKVERLEEMTDVGINAPANTIGRPVWICQK